MEVPIRSFDYDGGSTLTAHLQNDDALIASIVKGCPIVIVGRTQKIVFTHKHSMKLHQGENEWRTEYHGKNLDTNKLFRAIFYYHW